MIQTVLRRLACFSPSLVVAVLMIVALGCEPPQDSLANWKPFSPPGGKFTVLLPSTPVEQIPKTNTGLEAKKYHIVSTMSNISGLAIAYADQPGRVDVQIEPKKLFDSLRAQAEADLRGQLISESEITLQGRYPGRELKLAVPGGFTALQKTYLVNRRLYSLIVVAGSKGLDSPEAQKFFNSFQVLP
ncbi:MAG: hypothetical protein FJ403_22720 [Verrucomicrobia bacterium]|nr:hypothetical protein [Verrucomicrobiota bacterium]